MELMTRKEFSISYTPHMLKPRWEGVGRKKRPVNRPPPSAFLAARGSLAKSLEVIGIRGQRKGAEREGAATRRHRGGPGHLRRQKELRERRHRSTVSGPYPQHSVTPASATNDGGPYQCCETQFPEIRAHVHPAHTTNAKNTPRLKQPRGHLRREVERKTGTAHALANFGESDADFANNFRRLPGVARHAFPKTRHPLPGWKSGDGARSSCRGASRGAGTQCKFQCHAKDMNGGVIQVHMRRHVGLNPKTPDDNSKSGFRLSALPRSVLKRPNDLSHQTGEIEGHGSKG